MWRKRLANFSLAGFITVALLVAFVVYVALLFSGVIGIGGLHD